VDRALPARSLPQRAKQPLTLAAQPDTEQGRDMAMGLPAMGTEARAMSRDRLLRQRATLVHLVRRRRLRRFRFRLYSLRRYEA
jgi:hypothetical protein